MDWNHQCCPLASQDSGVNSNDVVSLYQCSCQEGDGSHQEELEDKTLSDQTNDAEDVMSILEFVMSTTYFQFDGQYYQQVHGASMGSPVSVVASDMLMEYLEEETMGHSSAGHETQDLASIYR